MPGRRNGRRSMGEVIPLFKNRPAADPQRRRCFNCSFAIATERGSYCDLFTEWILNEKEAVDCDAFDDMQDPAS